MRIQNSFPEVPADDQCVFIKGRTACLHFGDWLLEIEIPLFLLLLLWIIPQRWKFLPGQLNSQKSNLELMKHLSDVPLPQKRAVKMALQCLFLEDGMILIFLDALRSIGWARGAETQNKTWPIRVCGLVMKWNFQPTWGGSCRPHQQREAEGLTQSLSHWVMSDPSNEAVKPPGFTVQHLPADYPNPLCLLVKLPLNSSFLHW